MTMTYSSALFASADEPLAEAQRRKYRRILDQLDARPGQTVLEIGCGWGGFAEIAAREYGCKVLGVTLSASQLAFARQRSRDGGYADRVDFELCDYRDVRGSYDHIVSIEMLEAVGERFWKGYFGQLAERLKPGGRAVVQVISIDEKLFPRYRRGTDFIQRYIFRVACCQAPSGSVAWQKARRWRSGRFRLRARLCAYAGALARTFRRMPGERPRSRLRRALRAHVAFLPRILRSRLQGR